MKLAYRAVMTLALGVFVAAVWIPAVWQSNINRVMAVEISVILAVAVVDSMTQLMLMLGQMLPTVDAPGRE